MDRASSPSKFSSHLEIARQIIAGAVEQDNIEAIFAAFQQSGDGDASLENLTAAQHLLKLHSNVVSETLSVGVNLPPLVNCFSIKTADKFHSCVAVFNLYERMKLIRNNIWSSLNTGHFLGCQTSDEVNKRLLMAKERPSLASHLYMSATDHFVNDIIKLLDEVPGTHPIGKYGRIWVSSYDDDFEKSISWIASSGITQFVDFLLIFTPERKS